MWDAVVRDYPRWMTVLEKLSAKEMPPKTMPQPSAEASEGIVNWIQAMRLRVKAQ